MEIKRGGASPAGNLRQEKRSYCSRCHPPSRLLGVGPAPFPGDCGKGGGRCPGYMSPSPGSGAHSAAGPRGVGALLVPRFAAALGQAQLFGQACFGI